ncbi:hypothetical protein ANAPC1_00514 [Anaplasma phagocytophilum]|uniref:Uncharacterized protein n=2 Tax=Anaplasma phagocytophilum TaxID=948 RepID=A0AA45ZHC9_ANAPH|nr:hypothetical protein [Anaplasma phagocytophilum]QLL66537.1 hypothetical protein O998_01435 [Anaplasma phagocytophilum str. Norway variant1]SBO14170.1 hypothetical protein ANAPC1_00514 [Anaplasma phagocytophilum]
MVFTVDFKDYGVVCREERVQLLREGKRWVFERGILGDMSMFGNSTAILYSISVRGA